MRTQYRYLCLLILTLLLPTGCSGFTEPIYNVGSRKLLLVPFRDMTAPRHLRWYGLSPRGATINRALRQWCESESVGQFVLGNEAEVAERKITNWIHDKIEAEDWRRIASGTDAELILVGKILQFRTKQPEDVNILRGSAKFEYQVIRASSGKTVYSTPEPREVFYPEMNDMRIPNLDMGLGEDHKKIERGLIRALTKRVGGDLYGFYPD